MEKAQPRHLCQFTRDGELTGRGWSMEKYQVHLLKKLS